MPVEGERFHDTIANVPTPSRARSVIRNSASIVVNLMNTDVPGPRIGSDQWNAIVANHRGSTAPLNSRSNER